MSYDDLQDRYITYQHVMGLGGGHLSALKHSGLTEKDVANLEGMSRRNERVMTSRGTTRRQESRDAIDPMGERRFPGPAPRVTSEPYADALRNMDTSAEEQPRRSVAEMNSLARSLGVLGGSFVEDFSDPEYRRMAAETDLRASRQANVENLERLITQRERIKTGEAAQAATAAADIERKVKEAFDKTFAETGDLEKAQVAADEARASLERAAAGAPVGAPDGVPAMLRRPEVDPQASGELIIQAMQDKNQGLLDLERSRLAQLRGLGAQLEDQYATERGSVLAQQAILAKQTEEQSEVNRAYREQERRRIESENVSRQLRAEAKEKAQQDIDEAVAEVVNFKIDPRRFYKNTGTALASAVAVALGEFGSKLAGGPNTALAIINRAIDQDINAQKTELQGLKYGAAAAGNAYKRLLDQHGDAEKAERLAREQALTFVGLKLGDIADKYKVPLQASKLGELISGIEKQRIANAMTISDKEFASRIEAAKLRPAVGKGSKLEAKDREFFQDMSEFQSGIQEMRQAYEKIGGSVPKQVLRWIVSGESKERFFQSLPDNLSPQFTKDLTQFAERGRLLSKTLSKMKEGGKISDMDLIFYMERMPLSTDSDSMILYKMEVLETLARNALRMRTELTQGEFNKFNERLKAQMENSGVTSGTNYESEQIKKQLGIKD